MTRTTKDERQGDIFALLEQPPAEPDEQQSDGEADDEAEHCARCGELGAVGEFWHHEATGGLICPNCIDELNPTCADCRCSLFDNHRQRALRKWIRPDGSAICYRCNEWRAMNKPGPELTADEATDEARALMATIQWDSEEHRNRATYRLREGFKSAARHPDAGASKAALAKQRQKAMIDAERVRRLWGITRHRPLSELAEALWPLVLENDTNHREGRGHDPELHKRIDELLAEANGGTRCGIAGHRRDFPGPHRLWTLIRWRARREGRLPMWGVPGVIRFECRGMHVICSSSSRSRGHRAEGFHLDRDRHRPGDPSFSSTGYRSLHWSSFDGCSPEEGARRSLEAFIDGPTKDGIGLGGKLERWIPWEAEPWLELVNYAKRHPWDNPTYRAECPAMTPAEERPAYWAKRDRELREKADKALAWMQARGIDPYDLFPDAPRQDTLF